MPNDLTPPHQRISDYSACPACVDELRAEPYATDYVNFNGHLHAYCVRHHTRWVITRELLTFPDVTERPALLLLGYTEVTPHHRFSWANRDIQSLVPGNIGSVR